MDLRDIAYVRHANWGIENMPFLCKFYMDEPLQHTLFKQNTIEYLIPMKKNSEIIKNKCNKQEEICSHKLQNEFRMSPGVPRMIFEGQTT